MGSRQRRCIQIILYILWWIEAKLQKPNTKSNSLYVETFLAINQILISAPVTFGHILTSNRGTKEKTKWRTVPECISQYMYLFQWVFSLFCTVHLPTNWITSSSEVLSSLSQQGKHYRWATWMNKDEEKQIVVINSPNSETTALQMNAQHNQTSTGTLLRRSRLVAPLQHLSLTWCWVNWTAHMLEESN